MIVVLLISGLAGVLEAQEYKPIHLLNPDRSGGLPVMEALSVKASVTEWSARPISLQELSDLLWAANGINRPDGKRTASSAQNAQDIDIYVFMKEGVYMYHASGNRLDTIARGDFLELTGKTNGPVNLVLVSDISRFRSGSDSSRIGWGNIDAGIVSQNISLFCAGKGLKTRPRASFPDMVRIREVLRLKSTQIVILNHPVGYAIE